MSPLQVPSSNLRLELEGRYDPSTAAVFTSSAGGGTQTQALVLLGAVASF